jgi:hypothetical protein
MAVAPSNINNFGIRKGRPIEMIAQDFEVVINCEQMSAYTPTANAKNYALNDHALIALENLSAFSGSTSMCP